MAKGKGKMKLATDAELFAVDATGDERLRSQIQSSTWDAPAAAHPRKGSGKPLKSQEILAMRSRVPARTSKSVPGVMVQQKKELEKRSKVTPQLKRRLRSMVKRNDPHDRGLWDVATHDNAAPLSSAVLASGSYDVWLAENGREAGPSHSAHEDIRELVAPPRIKAPATINAHALFSTSQIPASILLPHPGQSYNPTFEEHQALLAAEHAKAAADEEAAKKLAKLRERVMRGAENHQDAYTTGYAAEVGSGDEGSADGNADQLDASPKKIKTQKRKTDKEKRRRATNRELEARTRAQARLTKAQRQALSNLPQIKGSIDESSAISLAELHKRKTALAQRLAATGLADLRSGPARVPLPKQSYLLSEELPETLRHLKTDGNLWADWIDSSRRRGKVQMERKSYGRMTKKRGRGFKDVEKATWRNFQV